MTDNLSPRIESNRLLLRPFDYGDEKDILKMLENDRERLKDVLDKKIYEAKTVPDIKDYITEVKTGWKLANLFVWGIWLKPSLRLIGQRYLFNIDWQKKRVEGGGFIIYEFEGQLIPKEAAELCVDYAFNTLKVEEILTSCKVNNLASIFGIERSGYDRTMERKGIIFYRLSLEKYLRRKIQLTKENYFEKYICIRHDGLNLAGIYRGIEKSSNLIILLPALTGTRTGPQRIFVDISRKLALLGISSYCVDIPPMGDSIDGKNQFDSIEEKYCYYLDLIIAHFENNFGFKKYILLSISMGCLPSLKYATQKNIQKVILLSPSDSRQSKHWINVKNLRAYYYKLFQSKTWNKFFRYKLNYCRIITNILGKHDKNISSITDDFEEYEYNMDNRSVKNAFDLLCIVGGRYYSRKILLNYKRIGAINRFKEICIQNSDHSFFTWNSRKQVIQYITNWLR